MNKTKLCAGLIILTLNGCGWVDSTGNQQSPAPALVDSTLVILDEGEPIVINENTQRTVVFSNADNRATDWSWNLLDGQANIKSCQGFDDIEELYISNSLSQACASNDTCEINIEEIVIEDVTRFEVTTPHMRAPAALEYQLSARTDTGALIERTQLLCAVPINEAPDTEDKEITVMRGTTLHVSGEDKQSLLFNVTDDQDVRNQGLQVITTAQSAPQYAALFELFSDGGFIYEPDTNAPITENGSISDRFTYEVSDGTNTSLATVSVKVIEFNTAPTQSAELPEARVSITNADSDLVFGDLLNYFADAQNDELKFTVDDSTLPASGNLYLTSAGQLIGNPAEYDSGRYFVELSVSDSFESIDAGFYLNVVRSNGQNKVPYANDISNKTVTDQFRYDVATFFGDANADHLSFTATGLPTGVNISPDGVIYGTSSNSNRGRVIVRVTADDGNGGTASDGFRLTLR